MAFKGLVQQKKDFYLEPEKTTACRVAQMRELIEERIGLYFQTVDEASLCLKLWQGTIKPRELPEILLSSETLSLILKEIEGELNSQVPGGDFKFKRDFSFPFWGESLLREVRGGRSNALLAWAGAEASKKAWKGFFASWGIWGRAAKGLKIPKAATKFFDLSPQGEKERSLKKMVKMLKGYKLTLQKGLIRDLSLQVARYLWSQGSQLRNGVEIQS